MRIISSANNLTNSESVKLQHYWIAFELNWYLKFSDKEVDNWPLCINNFHNVHLISRLRDNHANDNFYINPLRGVKSLALPASLYPITSMSVTRNRMHSRLFFPPAPDKHRPVAKEEKNPGRADRRARHKKCVYFM